MFKGIVALFTSGLILNPMVLSGIVLALFAMMKLKPEQMQALFTDHRLYGAVALLSFIYSFVFKRVYKDDALSLDYAAMTLTFIAGIVRFILACGLTISFVIMLFSF